MQKREWAGLVAMFATINFWRSHNRPKLSAMLARALITAYFNLRVRFFRRCVEYNKKRYPNVRPSAEMMALDSILELSALGNRLDDPAPALFLKVWRWLMSDALPILQSLNHPTAIHLVHAKECTVLSASGGVPMIWCNWPGVASDSPVILYLHGGGFTAGNIGGYRMFGGQLSRATGYRVLLVEYAIAPEHPLPQGADDCLEAYKWLLQHQPPAKLMLAGDSAGGGLVCLLLQKIRDLSLPSPAGAVVMSPWLDLTNSLASRESNLKRDMTISLPSAFEIIADFAVSEGASRADPGVSPLFGTWNDLPPLLFMVGATERVRDDSVEAAEKIWSAGGTALLEEHPYCPHIYPTYCIAIPEGREALGRMAQFCFDCVGVNGWYDNVNEQVTMPLGQAGVMESRL
eukprot:TRINITY_DN9003_c0_g1_i2.p1 TRINITY_DN9003_c0_g1~~TRINITY_DN9003_c0_g1_i2.p1  ORF type:complete len:403 (+),score=69.64 TRINITY_DN9003_c0_g1_i2:159-1367(+)